MLGGDDGSCWEMMGDVAGAPLAAVTFLNCFLPRGSSSSVYTPVVASWDWTTAALSAPPLRCTSTRWPTEKEAVAAAEGTHDASGMRSMPSVTPACSACARAAIVRAVNCGAASSDDVPPGDEAAAAARADAIASCDDVRGVN